MLQDYIINDPSKTLGHLVSQTIPSYEFAKTFGAKGELLKTIRKEIHQNIILLGKVQKQQNQNRKKYNTLKIVLMLTLVCMGID